MLDDGKKRPRGIRFTDDGYAKLQKACESSECSHLDEFILSLMNTKTMNAKIDAATRKITDAVVSQGDILLTGVEKLLDKYTS